MGAEREREGESKRETKKRVKISAQQLRDLSTNYNIMSICADIPSLCLQLPLSLPFSLSLALCLCSGN